MRHRALGAAAAFSLVEIAIALGILSVCSIAVLGLLLGGGRIVSDSWQRTVAGDAVVAVCNSLKASVKHDDGSYYPNRPYAFESGGCEALKKLVWKIADTTPQAIDLKVDRLGKAVNTTAEAEFAMHIDFDIPSSLNSQGSLFCTAAWPASATWNADSGWSNCSGFVDMWIPFTPPKD